MSEEPPASLRNSTQTVFCHLRQPYRIASGTEETCRHVPPQLKGRTLERQDDLKDQITRTATYPNYPVISPYAYCETTRSSSFASSFSRPKGPVVPRINLYAEDHFSSAIFPDHREPVCNISWGNKALAKTISAVNTSSEHFPSTIMKDSCFLPMTKFKSPVINHGHARSRMSIEGFSDLGGGFQRDKEVHGNGQTKFISFSDIGMQQMNSRHRKRSLNVEWNTHSNGNNSNDLQNVLWPSVSRQSSVAQAHYRNLVGGQYSQTDESGIGRVHSGNIDMTPVSAGQTPNLLTDNLGNTLGTPNSLQTGRQLNFLPSDQNYCMYSRFARTNRDDSGLPMDSDQCPTDGYRWPKTAIASQDIESALKKSQWPRDMDLLKSFDYNQASWSQYTGQMTGQNILSTASQNAVEHLRDGATAEIQRNPQFYSQTSYTSDTNTVNAQQKPNVLSFRKQIHDWPSWFDTSAEHQPNNLLLNKDLMKENSYQANAFDKSEGSLLYCNNFQSSEELERWRTFAREQDSECNNSTTDFASSLDNVTDESDIAVENCSLPDESYNDLQNVLLSSGGAATRDTSMSQSELLESSLTEEILQLAREYCLKHTPRAMHTNAQDKLEYFDLPENNTSLDMSNGYSSDTSVLPDALNVNGNLPDGRNSVINDLLLSHDDTSRNEVTSSEDKTEPELTAIKSYPETTEKLQTTDQVTSTSDVQDVADAGDKADNKQNIEAEPRRPKNGFIRFSIEHRQTVAAKHPRLDNREISRLLGCKWRKMSAEDKKCYEEAFEKDIKSLREQHPDWRYAPAKHLAEDLVEPMPSRLRPRNTLKRKLPPLVRPYRRHTRKSKSGKKTGKDQAEDWEPVWVQCDLCGKWQCLPFEPPQDTVSNIWFCFCNPDPRFKNCTTQKDPTQLGGTAQRLVTPDTIPVVPCTSGSTEFPFTTESDKSDAYVFLREPSW